MLNFEDSLLEINGSRYVIYRKGIVGVLYKKYLIVD